jgi:hypothetical protein
MPKPGKPKKGSARLPAWFDIQKYRATKDFGIQDWFQQLAFRNCLFEGGAFHQKEYSTKFLDLLKCEPIVTEENAREPLITRRNGRIVNLNWEADKIISSIFYLTPYVEGLVNFDMIDMLKNNLQEKFKKDGRALGIPLFIGHGKSFSELSAEDIKYFESPLCYRKRRILAINLDAQDEFLIGEFRDFLREQKRISEKTPIPNAENWDFKNWFKCGLLPYLDLKLWELLKGESFHWASFGESLTEITNMRYGSESALIKAVKSCEKTARSLITLEALQVQAQRKNNKRSKKYK